MSLRWHVRSGIGSRRPRKDERPTECLSKTRKVTSHANQVEYNDMDDSNMGAHGSVDDFMYSDVERM